MNNNHTLITDIVNILHALHEGELENLDSMLDAFRDKIKNTDFERDGIDFIQQVEFQKDYDYNHLLTEEIKATADKLLLDLGVKKLDKGS